MKDFFENLSRAEGIIRAFNIVEVVVVVVKVAGFGKKFFNNSSRMMRVRKVIFCTPLQTEPFQSSLNFEGILPQF